jgi:hypothetical protein
LSKCSIWVSEIHLRLHEEATKAAATLHFTSKDTEGSSPEVVVVVVVVELSTNTILGFPHLKKGLGNKLTS